MADNNEAVQTALEALNRARADLTGAPGDTVVHAALVSALHIFAARLRQAGREAESAGLGTEAVTVLTTTSATGDQLRGMAENAVYIGAYEVPSDEAVTVTSAAATVLRTLRPAAPAPQIDGSLLWTLHNLAARLRQAGREAESAGLGTEAVTVLTTTSATGDQLRGMAENAVYIGAYEVPGDEAVTVTSAAATVLRTLRAAAPAPQIDGSLLWTVHNLAARLRQAGREAESAGLGTEAVTVLTTTSATGDQLRGMAENAVYIAAYIGKDTERVETGTAARDVLAKLFAADPANAVNAAKYGWAEELLRQWRQQAGLSPQAPAAVPGAAVPGPAVLDPGLRLHFDDGTPVSALCRNPNQMDVFAVGRDGTAQSTWWNGQWRERFRVGSATFPAASPIGVVSRSPDFMDLFVVGADGGVWNAWWHGEWHDWYRLGDIALPDRSPVATLSRSPDYQDIFAVGHDGRVWSTWWHGEWHPWFTIGDVTLPDRTPIATLSRNPDQMDIFAVGHDGRVWSTWWHGEWQPWFTIGAATFPHGATIAAVARSSDIMDLFAVGPDGGVWSTWWDGHWHEWFRIGAAQLPPGAPVAVLSRNPDQLDVFGVADGGIQSTWWRGGWAPWYRIPFSLRAFSRSIESGGLAALGGWATVAVLDDGSTRFYGHARNSGIDSYGVSLGVLIAPRGGGAALAFHRYTDVGSHEEQDWDDRLPASPAVIRDLRRYLDGTMTSNLEYSSGLADAVRDTIAWSTTIVIGWTPAGLAVAPIIMMGGALYSWIDQGSPLPGLMSTGSMVWMAGPTGMLVAYPVQQWVGDATTSRVMSEQEIAWARHIFGDRLPTDRIRITKLIGHDNRAFAGLVHNNTITINMGEEGYNDPWSLHATGPTASRAWGETFAHELVHAWQLEHYSDPTEIARVLAAQLQELTGDPYVYGTGAPWHAYNPEAQANIVSQWYADHLNRGDQNYGLTSPAALADPRFHYVRDNIRVGAT